MNFDKLSFMDKDDWMLLFGLLPLILGILVFLALMIFYEI